MVSRCALCQRSCPGLPSLLKSPSSVCWVAKKKIELASGENEECFYKEIEVLLASKTENNIHPSLMEAGEQKAGLPLPLPPPFLLHVALSSLREKGSALFSPPSLALHQELPLTTACSKTSESRFQTSSGEAWFRPLFGEKPPRCRSLQASGDTPLCLSAVT